MEDDLNGTGCFMDVITMNCVLNSTLSITNAIYGKYANLCNGCCLPSQDDCSVEMSEQSPTDWAALLAKCDGKTSCSHEYTGEVINDCEPGYVADYMQISYTCSLGLQTFSKFTHLIPTGFILPILG